MLKQGLGLKQNLSLSPQQIQFMKMIELPAQVFIRQVEDEVWDNPLLEVVDEDEQSDLFTEGAVLPSRIPPSPASKSRDYEVVDQYISSNTLFDTIEAQVLDLFLEPKQQEVVLILAGYLNPIGYLERSVEDIQEDVLLHQNKEILESEILEGLAILRSLDPSGIGCSDLQECLSIQLHRKKENTSRKQAKNIIDYHFDLLVKKHYDKLIQKLDISKDDLQKAILEIEKLHPKPGAVFNSLGKQSHYISPDFEVLVAGEQIKVSLTMRAPKLTISKVYEQALFSNGAALSSTFSISSSDKVVKEKFEQAKWYLKAIQQREETLLSTMKAIVKLQKPYFFSGDEEDIRPMTMKQIAEMVDLDISTISRTVKDKYVLTPYGIKTLKSFFSEGYITDKDVKISTLKLKSTLKQIIESEPATSPYSDQELMVEMAKRGYKIARRTITKYREALGFQVARLRKNF